MELELLQELQKIKPISQSFTNWDEWDAQIIADYKAGKLDSLIDEAVQDELDGLTEEL